MTDTGFVDMTDPGFDDPTDTGFVVMTETGFVDMTDIGCVDIKNTVFGEPYREYHLRIFSNGSLLCNVM